LSETHSNERLAAVLAQAWWC